MVSHGKKQERTLKQVDIIQLQPFEGEFHRVENMLIVVYSDCYPHAPETCSTYLAIQTLLVDHAIVLSPLVK